MTTARPMRDLYTATREAVPGRGTVTLTREPLEWG